MSTLETTRPEAAAVHSRGAFSIHTRELLRSFAVQEIHLRHVLDRISALNVVYNDFDWLFERMFARALKV